MRNNEPYGGKLMDMFHVFTEASPQKFFTQGVNLEFSDSSPPPLDGTQQNTDLSPLYRFWDMKKYVGNVKKYLRNMKEIIIMKKYVDNMKKYAENVKK